MADEPSERDLPVSWDEAREVAVVVLLAAALMAMLSPIVGWFNPSFRGTVGDDLAFITSRVAPSTSLLLLAAALIVTTTPRDDVVPALRRAVVVVASIAVAMGLVAIVVELTRVSGAGLAARLQSVFGRPAPATLVAGLSRWLVMRVVPFDG